MDGIEHLIQSVQVGFDRRHNNIGVGPLTVDNASATFQTHGHFALRIGPLGYRIDRIQLEPDPAIDNHFDRPIGGIDRSVAVGLGGVLFAVDRQRYRRDRRFAGFGMDPARDQFNFLVSGREVSVGHKRLDVLVVNLRFAIGELFESFEGFVEVFLAREIDSQFFQPRAKRITPGQLAEDDAIGIANRHPGRA